MGRLLIGLNDKRAQDPRIAGGKGAGLARLVHYGFKVPPAFIITTSAFRRFQSSWFREMKSGTENITSEHLGGLRKRIVNTPLPTPVQNAVADALSALGVRVAIRSSMAGEDSCYASFAGLLDSVLNIKDDQDATAAVRRCLASSFNWRLWKYQLSQGQSLRRIRKTLSMAVIIQEMVDAQVSGVAFSSDPNTGARDVVIEAVPGLGENLIQGRVVPFRYVIDDSGNLEQVQMRAGNVLPFDRREILELAGTVRKITAICKSPQDIEWAWDGRDFYFLQCRPITALPSRRLYSARLVADMSPGLVKPLLWSTKSRSMVRSVFGRICRELLGPHQIDFATYIKRIHSRTYADMTAFGDFLIRLGLPSNFFEMITRHEKPNWRLSLLQPGKIPVLFRMMRFALHHFRADKEIASFIRIQTNRLQSFRCTDWSALSPSELIDIFDRLMELHAQTQWYVFIGPLNMTLRYRLLSRILKGISETINPGNLLRGVEGLKALAPNSCIMQMSRLAQDLDRHTLDLMLQGEDQKLEGRLSRSEKGRQIRQHFRDFISRFGFLSANGSDFSAVPWSEDPSPVWRSIGRLALHKPSWNMDRIQQMREKEVLRIRSQLNGVRRILFDRLLRSIIRYMKLRESTSLIMSEETFLMRRALMNIALRFTEEGRLAEPSDIFFLYYDELCLFINDNLDDGEIMGRIIQRKNKISQDALIDPPDIIRGAGLPPLQVTAGEESDYLEGISASPGRVRGKARIVMDPSTVSIKLNSEDILIVPFTDVGWTPLLPGIGGIIAETGGQLSHTSIIAREYGLPSVVSVRDATRRIREGQPVTIDGDRGRVYLKHV